MNELSELSTIKEKIYTIRGVQVMLDSDLAQLYQVETRVLNQSVKRNQNRFPDEFCFQLTKAEFENLKSQFVISSGISEWGGVRKMPYVFTEHGVTMLSAVLRSDIAVSIGIRIVQSFVSMRHYLADNAMVFQRLDRVELKQLEADEKFRQIFKQLEAPKQNKAIIFFKGQMWDAVNCIEEIISKAQKSVILIDGYVDRNTLAILTGKKANVSVTIYTSEKNCRITEQESKSFSSQYGSLSIKFTDEFHDRFIILDEKELYHIGASIKDAGKKAFEISINEDEKLLDVILKRLHLIYRRHTRNTIDDII